YYLNVEARGADGRNYHIKKTINLLRRFDEQQSGGTH
ncbi:MAG: gliding motility-associated C-terminal domain-containing protein, partial [Prevotellaceae bacterium]|nr:gliding motility-associated C-terminal domain-containing protein [Prevotellaceae bacterium]